MNPNRLRTARPVAKLKQGRTDWYKMRNLSDSSAEVLIYDEIGYWGVTAQDFVNDLNALDVSQIDVRINSPGGEVYDGIAIHGAIQRHPANVTVYVDALAASAASFIAMAGDKVVMARNSEMMIHDASTIAIGNADDMREVVDLLERVSENIADIYAQKAGGEVADWRAKMKAETWYSAQEAVDAGLADEVAASDSKETTDAWDLSIFNYTKRGDAPAPIGGRVAAPALDLTAIHRAFEEAWK